MRKLSQENSEGLQSVIIDKIKKEIELKQAYDGIRDIRKKESTVRFSLLFNIKFPEKHGMPKEIELIMKVPTIQNEITVLNKQKPYEKLKSTSEAEIAYYKVLLAEHNLNYFTSRIEDSTQVLKEVKARVQSGKGKKEDQEYVENQLKGFEKDREKAILTLDNAKQKLGKLIGKDVRVGYSFEEYLPELSLTRNQLPAVIEYAKANDFELFETIQKRKLAEREVQELLSIYKGKYGGYISSIENYIRSREGKTIDYETFIQSYNYTLYQIDSPWYGNYVINLLFFKIRIPKEWFKGEYDGTRYMEDQKYALFVALVDRDKARKEEKQAIEKLEQTIKDGYSNLKEMESALRETRSNLENAEINYTKARQKNKMGLLDFSSLESTRDNLYAQQQSLYEMQIDYAQSLSTFDKTTSGYITKLLTGGDSETGKYEAGDSFIEDATWYIKNTITEYNFVFGVNIPSEYGVDTYQLYYGETPVGGKIKIEDPLIHEPLTYNDSTVMNLKFYKGEELKYVATMEGDQYEGTLKLEKVEGGQKTGGQQEAGSIGKWQLSDLDALRKEFGFELTEPYDYDSYTLLYQNNEIGKADKGKKVKTLALYFSEIEQIECILEKGGNKVTTIYFQKSLARDGNVISRK